MSAQPAHAAPSLLTALQFNASAIEAALNYLASGQPDKARKILDAALAQSKRALNDII